MIYNPAIVSGGGQVYSITDNSGLGFPTSAEAGTYVQSDKTGAIGGVYDADGVSVPYRISGQTVFVMPQSDVKIWHYGTGPDVPPPE